MIYLDNGATSFPKPHSVYSEMMKAMKTCGGNPGRGSNTLARRASDTIYKLRECAAEMFGAESENVILTYNATHALNLAIKGLARDGCHILMSDIEHNSVRRPVASLCRQRGCTYDVYPSCGGDAGKIIENLQKLVKDNTKLLVMCHTSNIANLTLPAYEIGKFCRKRGIAYVIDASQSAGHIPVDLKHFGADAVCIPGHKGLYGPAGTGLLIIRDGQMIEGLMEGGSGVNSIEDTMPDFYPDRLEAGTLSAPLAAGLCRGISWVRCVGIQNIHAHECELSGLLLDYLCDMDGIRVYNGGAGQLTSTVLFNVSAIPSVRVGELLDNSGICVRCGLHCSPLAHKTLKTGDGGAVRVSFGAFNTVDHVRRLVDEVHYIKKYEN
ncbi:MAG: aminotransferase class V-fold PLP-dependent enzyme [Clostridia bacterium]|nr:aminotransferase class V-fold PLP-dependent enzyme [Clostridia bacterium]